jgi:hypothetical protein
VCGNILDVPNAPEGNIYQGKIRLKSYPRVSLAESSGCIWDHRTRCLRSRV